MSQPERVPIRRLQQHASEIIAHVEAGHRVEITRNGRLVAVLTPPDREETGWHDLVDRGLVDAADDRRGSLSGWHTPRGRTSVPLSEALAAVRDEESHR